MSRVRAAAAGACTAAFAALAWLVATGALTSLDRWAMRHAMPGAHFTGGKPTLADAIVPFRGERWSSGVDVATNVLTTPAGLVVATAIVVLACRRIRGRPAAALAAAYVAGNVVEAVTKTALTRPPLSVHGVHVAAFDNSFPSGHTIRIVLVALALAWAWPALRWIAGAWAAATVAFLELGAWHVPSDIAGGLLVGGALVATTWSSRYGAATASRRPSPACPPSARAR